MTRAASRPADGLATPMPDGALVSSSDRSRKAHDFRQTPQALAPRHPRGRQNLPGEVCRSGSFFPLRAEERGADDAACAPRPAARSTESPVRLPAQTALSTRAPRAGATLVLTLAENCLITYFGGIW